MKRSYLLLLGAVSGAIVTAVGCGGINVGADGLFDGPLAGTSSASSSSGGGSGGEGGQHAEAQVEKVMEESGASREEALAAIQKAQGGYAAIRAKELQRLKDRMYAEACAAFDESHKADFGTLEEQGPECGFRGEFRSTLRMILYADD